MIIIIPLLRSRGYTGLPMSVSLSVSRILYEDVFTVRQIPGEITIHYDIFQTSCLGDLVSASLPTWLVGFQ